MNTKSKNLIVKEIKSKIRHQEFKAALISRLEQGGLEDEYDLEVAFARVAKNFDAAVAEKLENCDFSLAANYMGEF